MIHGTKKQKKQKSEQQKKQEQQLSNKINAKLSDFFQIRNKTYSDQQIPKYLDFTALLMQLCSDIPTIFNFRRQVLLRAIKLNQTDIKQSMELLVNQIKLITKLIRDDPKSYTLWSYRQWLVQNIYQSNRSIINQQKQLCKLLLTKDQKNFHVWNYRNWINSIQLNIDEQLQFTQQKIKSNPFNFSPYHFRSKYLPLKYNAFLNDNSKSEEIKTQILNYGMPKQIFQSQLQKIKTAIYLNPNQQAPWIYYRWLLKRLIPVIILSENKVDNKHRIILNQRVLNLDKLVKFSEASHNLTLQSVSNIWQFESEGVLEKMAQSDYGKRLVETDGVQRQLSNSGTEAVSNARVILQGEIKFMGEIAQEEPQCRLVYLQRLQLLKNKLHLRCSWQQWEEVIKEGKKCLQVLEESKKTRNYIERVRDYWVRIQKKEGLREEQRLLIKED